MYGATMLCAWIFLGPVSRSLVVDASFPENHFNHLPVKTLERSVS